MKVGDYVRLDNNRGIRKIKEFAEHIDYYVFDKPVLDRWGKVSYSHFGIKEQILKSSPNIIDLIEVGDYVNGLKVSRVGETYHGRKDKAIYCDYCVDKETGKWTMIYDDEIKSIVTKEQFKSMEYRIEE